MMTFSLNQVSAPELGWSAFLQAAKRIGCSGVELRNDLGRDLFDGEDSQTAKARIESSQMALFAVAEIAGFNDLDAAGFEQACALIETAAQSGASAVALIPRVGADAISLEQSSGALAKLAPILKGAGLKGLVEPIGFVTSSLRTKGEALAAIAMSGAPDCFGVIHDTFHHYISGETEFYADRTDMVHVSGVTSAKPACELADADRGLIGVDDVMGNIEQLRALMANGYEGPVSLEAFSPAVQALGASEKEFGATFDYLRHHLEFSNTAAEA